MTTKNFYCSLQVEQDLIELLGRTQKVIQSCNTVEQYVHGQKYAQLAGNRMAKLIRLCARLDKKLNPELMIHELEEVLTATLKGAWDSLPESTKPSYRHIPKKVILPWL